MNSEAFARKRLVECCHMLYDRNLTVSAGGNMSVRINDREILITPSGVNKGLVREDDLVKMDMDGNVLSGGKPSIEHKFHLGIYRENPETNAVVHCHPLYCLAILTRGEDLKSTLTPEGVLLLDQVPTCRYATPGSDELVEAVMEYANAPAMLMARHGAITQGRTLEEAYNRMEELEFQAHLQILAGNAEELPMSEIMKLREMR
ncbi:MAG: class II aldolase/adducin family protein [Candidatus Methanomethylophilus sp.]|jgi:L-fuculose-phosphate aldolase|nr:class II aldolase/adducin family protein [Methanomethylophilus sp.]